MLNNIKKITEAIQITESLQIILEGTPLLNFMDFRYQDDKQDLDTLKKQLTDLIYTRFYSRTEFKNEKDKSFLENLRKNNFSKKRIQKGYQLEIVQELPYIASKGSHRVALHPGMFVTPKKSEPGQEAWIYQQPEITEDAFYHVFSYAPVAFFRESILRFYFNTNVDGALLLMQFLTKKLNAAKLPFELKTIWHTRNINRSDNFVLYTDYRFLDKTMSVLKAIPSEITGHFFSQTPLFTYPVARGIAFAESPENPKESFGTLRCGLIAEGILHAFMSKTDSLSSVLKIIEERGFKLEYFYLNPGSRFKYNFWE